MILKAYDEYSFDVFQWKQDSFHESGINHIRYLRKTLLPIILAGFSKLNDFIINFVAKEVALNTFVWYNRPFVDIFPIWCFHFGCIALEENAESTEICQT